VNTPFPQPHPAPSEPEAGGSPDRPGTTPEVDTTEFPTTPAPPAPPSPVPSPPAKRRITVLGDYRLGERLGAGAMGAVYRAWQISRDRPAAVKVLRPHIARNPLFLERFRREAHILARLNHPNIVRCYGVGRQHHRHYLAMELVEGHSLGDWLYHLGRVSVGDAVYVALAVGRALQYAHQSGLVHRDVKPDNILVTPTGGIKLADLGLAKGVFEEDASMTQTGHGAGTPVYMAPEQARNAKHADPRSDLYALGCVLYHMLTGQFPFRGPSTLEVILAKLEGKCTPAREVNPEVPPELDAFLSLLLAADPEQRYQSATDVLNELDDLGFANRSLQFIREHSAPGRVKGTTSDLTATPVGSSTEEQQLWYVLHRTSEGKWLTRKMTTGQIREELQDRHFAQTAQASLSRGDYRSLVDLPEFRETVLARTNHSPDSVSSAPTRDRRRFWPYLLIGLTSLLAVGTAGFLIAKLLFSGN
jgi:eukaryotic-like serine/threonine-protein kinase